MTEMPNYMLMLHMGCVIN